MEKIGAVLAVAGLSSRIRDFRPLLPFGDTTVAFHVTSMLRRLGADPILVVTGHRAEELEGHLKGIGAYFVRNTRYHRTQMFDSVELGMQAALEGCERILTMPIGLPAIADDIIRQVMEAPGQIMRTVHDGGPGHLICMEEEIAGRVYTYTGDQELRGTIGASGVPVEGLETGNENTCLDVDTREEYRELLRWVCR